MENSGVQWCHNSFNVWIGCTKVDEGCTNCYAEADQDTRKGRVSWGANGTRSKTSESYWKQPARWQRQAKESGEPIRVFCGSLCDWAEDWRGDMQDHRGEVLWHEEPTSVREASRFNFDRAQDGERRKVTMTDLRRRLIRIIDETPNLIWLMTSKRPDRYCELLGTKFRKNVWLLTSVSDQKTYDAKIRSVEMSEHLAPVMGLSYEPMLGPIDFGPRFGKFIKWVIFGGESGPHARGNNVDWMYSGNEQCDAAGVAVFNKQMGAFCEGVGPRPTFDVKGGKMKYWPEQLRRRELPVFETAV